MLHLAVPTDIGNLPAGSLAGVPALHIAIDSPNTCDVMGKGGEGRGGTRGGGGGGPGQERGGGFKGGGGDRRGDTKPQQI